jgi:hypothetical protein
MANAGMYEIEQQIKRLREVALLPREAAPAVALALKETLQRQIGAGKAPDGSTWEPRKEDGGKPLVHAAQALAVVPVGSTVFARLKGPEALHHGGRAKGGTVRQILPTTAMPQPMVQAIAAVVEETFVRIMESR